MRRQHRFSILDLGFWIGLVVTATFLGACQPSVKNAPVTPSPSPSASPSASPSVSPSGSPANKLESWVGKWQGVEGTYLTITRKVEDKTKPTAAPVAAGAEKFTIEIANLDGPKTYEGKVNGDHIEFVRNGKTETIKAETGAETGMKGFENEKNCLVVTKGSEGFCRKG